MQTTVQLRPSVRKTIIGHFKMDVFNRPTWNLLQRTWQSHTENFPAKDLNVVPFKYNGHICMAVLGLFTRYIVI